MAKPTPQIKTARPLPVNSPHTGDAPRGQSQPSAREPHTTNRRSFANGRTRRPQSNLVCSSVSTPLCFTSQLLPRIWGGRALQEVLQHSLPDDGPYGEAWDLSGLQNQISLVADGPHAMQRLTDLWAEHQADFTGSQFASTSSFPWLIKWLECREWLSLQVHPNDQMASRVLRQSQGKSEVWIVLEAQPEARVLAGLLPGVTRESLVQHLETGTLDRCLHSFRPRPGDCIQLPAGTIHSAGGGLLIAEIQQPSDATFRLYDWNRAGLDGKPRPLQVDLALEAVDWTAGPVSPSAPRLIEVAQPGVTGESLVDWPQFRLERYTLTTDWTPPHSGELVAWMVLDGVAMLKHGSTSEQREISRGRTVLVPASAGQIHWSSARDCSAAQLLCVRMPRPSLPERK